MTSFLEVDAADERHVRLASRKAIVIAKQRVEDQYGAWLNQAETREDLNARLAYAKEEIDGIIALAAEDQGTLDFANYYDVIVGDYTARFTEQPKTSSIHESRKPKMCPFHSDVVGISLAQGEAKSGFEAMAQHWGGPKHCQGEGYEGGKCNFKPQMTTQSWWDERTEKAEERKRERAENAELEVQTLDFADEATQDEFIDEVNQDVTPDSDEGAEVIDFPAAEVEAPVEEAPMSMAAKTADSDNALGLGGPEPVIDKRKWTPETVPFLDIDEKDGPHPTKHKDIVEPIKPINADKIDEIGEQVTEHQDVEKSVDYIKVDQQGGTWTKGPATAVASTKESYGEQFGGNIEQAIHALVSVGYSREAAEQIVANPPQGGTVPVPQHPHPIASVLPDDVDKNPITALALGDYDGFLPASTVQQALAAYRK